MVDMSATRDAQELGRGVRKTGPETLQTLQLPRAIVSTEAKRRLNFLNGATAPGGSNAAAGRLKREHPRSSLSAIAVVVGND